MTGALRRIADELRTSFPDVLGCAGIGSRCGLPDGIPIVRAPSGITRIEPEEMIVRCSAGTPVDELQRALAAHGQEVAFPSGGTVGGALAVGRSDILRLGRGPIRDTVLEIRYVSAAGDVVRAGGPTVKNVSGFDVCRLFVGSWGTLGLVGEVVLRTRPVPAARRWYRSDRAPDELLSGLYRPTSLLWDGTATSVCLEGHPRDLDTTAGRFGLQEVDGPPPLPERYRWSIPSRQIGTLQGSGRFVAEVGVGVVHHDDEPAPSEGADPVNQMLMSRVRSAFDPQRRFACGAGAPDDVRTLITGNV